jgi:hypothetical protein
MTRKTKLDNKHVLKESQKKRQRMGRVICFIFKMIYIFKEFH